MKKKPRGSARDQRSRDRQGGAPRRPVRSNRVRRQRRSLLHLLRPLLSFLGVATFAAALLTAVFLGGQMLAASDFFAVDNVRCAGMERVSEGELIAASEIHPGDAMFRLDMEAIGERITANPWIASTRVQRQFPSAVLIEVQERRPLAVIRLDYLYYVDHEGVIFKLLEAGDSFDFPLLSGFRRDDFEDETRAAESRDRLNRVCALLKELEERPLFNRTEVSEIYTDPGGELRIFTLDGGVPVRIGQGAFAEKLDRLERIYGELRQGMGAIRSIDLNVENRVIVRLNKDAMARKNS